MDGQGPDGARSAAYGAIEAVWRIESARVIAGLVRTVHDVGLAEDAAADALVAALEGWPATGVPENPGAWLMTIAKRKAIDAIRRRVALDRKYGEIAVEIEHRLGAADPEPDEVEDDLLRLMFVACHPVLSSEARVALTLRLLGGLTTEEIARAFLVPEPTIGQRISRAKRTLADADVGFEVPDGVERAERLASVLEVVYLIFNEGYSATAGDQWIRKDLCAEALRLGRILAALTPRDAEVHGLVALMEIQASRLRARTAPDGSPIRLADQDRGRWDHLQIHRGLAALEQAERRSDMRLAAALLIGGDMRLAAALLIGGDMRLAAALLIGGDMRLAAALLNGGDGTLGPYTLQAAIAACHAQARSVDETDWPRIATLYDVLARVSPSPVVELNRAVAVAMAYGPEVALPIVDGLADDPSMRGYHLLPSVRGDLLERLGRGDEASAEFTRAAALTTNVRERDLLLDRASAVVDPDNVDSV